MLRTALLGVVCSAFVAVGVPADVEESQAARSYVEEAWELVHANAYYADRLRGDEARDVIDRAVAGIDGLPDAHEAIELLVSLLDDRHSQFLRPAAVRELEHRSETQVQEPFGFRVTTAVGYLRLPPILTLTIDDERAHDYVERAWLALTADRGACAWIVDLRGNTGGTLAPMLAALAPLLGGGRAVGYTTRDGSTTWFAVGEDRITYDDAIVYRFDRSPRSLAGRRLAVLTDAYTASSGEGALIALLRKGATSWGGPTAGVPTGIVGFQLPDGALLLLTTALGTGRDGELFDRAIAPMVPMRVGTGRHDDSLVSAVADTVDDCQT